jgi:hypothetical protein
MRDKIAGIVRMNDGNLPLEDHYTATADAIVAALPGMIEPLVWEGASDMKCEAKFFYGRIYPNTGGNWTLDNGESVEAFDTPEEAQDEANAHHAAQVMAAFGVVL